MNIQNIIELTGQLQSLGFDNLGSLLLKRICFKPVNFYLIQRISKEKEVMLFSLYFERLQNGDTYILQYYDVALQKENGVATVTIDGINSSELEKQMAAIDWKKAFSIDERSPWSPDDKSTWDIELKISAVVEKLSALENSEPGKIIAASLKLKFWTGTLYQDVVGAITPVKNKSDVSQRFYITGNGAGITTDEACRFLQNKWMEKQLQLRKKQADNSSEINEEGTSGASGSGLLKKKRIAGKGKRNRINQD